MDTEIEYIKLLIIIHIRAKKMPLMLRKLLKPLHGIVYTPTEHGTMENRRTTADQNKFLLKSSLRHSLFYFLIVLGWNFNVMNYFRELHLEYIYFFCDKL